MTVKELKAFINDLPDEMLVLTSGIKEDELATTQAKKIKVEIKTANDFYGTSIYKEVDAQPAVSDTIVNAILIDLDTWL